MEKHQDVIRQVLLLLDTIEEGLAHMTLLVENLNFESAHDLLNDTFLGVMSIKEAIKPLAYELKSLSEKPFLRMQNQLIESFKATVLSFTQGQTQNYKSQLVGLMSLFEPWRDALLDALTPRGYH